MMLISGIPELLNLEMLKSVLGRMGTCCAGPFKVGQYREFGELFFRTEWVLARPAPFKVGDVGLSMYTLLVRTSFQR